MTRESDPYSCVKDIVLTTIRCHEGNGKLFHPCAAERIAFKCTPFFYAPSDIDKLGAAFNAEIIWSPNGIDRIEECTGGYKVLVGWQEWMLFREWMI